MSTSKTSRSRRPAALFLTGAAALIGASVTFAAFTNPYTPPYRGLPGTEYGAWDFFSVAVGGANLPDQPGATTLDASIAQLHPSAFLVGGNIYSFSAPVDCVLTDSVPSDLAQVDLQVSTYGNELDYAGVVLSYVDGQGATQIVPPTGIVVLFNGPYQGQGGGIAAETLFQWNLESNPDVITSYQISFKGAAPSVSLDAVILDTRFFDYATTYCTAKTNSQGCTTAIAAAGIPSASLAAPFDLTASNLLPNTVGLLIYSTAGPAVIPFQGGFLCMGTPIFRSTGQGTGGSAPCSGTLSIDFNAFVQAGQAIGVSGGSQVQAQFWSRDTGFAPPNASNLTDAVQFVVQN
jgi:hypothetical protein